MAVWFDHGVLMQDALHPLDPTSTDSHFMAAPRCSSRRNEQSADCKFENDVACCNLKK